MKEEGRGIDEKFMSALLIKRTQQKDCLKNGWVLEDYPQTRLQAEFLTRAGLTPTNVIYMRIPHEEVYKRTEKNAINVFECMRSIVAEKLRYADANLPQVSQFFSRLYNSLTEIDGMKSKWYVEDRALTVIQGNMYARQQFALNIFLKKPCVFQNSFYDRCIVKATLSQFGYFCPVTWKNMK
jgi:adenylate kinase family enzyme